MKRICFLEETEHIPRETGKTWQKESTSAYLGANIYGTLQIKKNIYIYETLTNSLSGAHRWTLTGSLVGARRIKNTIE